MPKAARFTIQVIHSRVGRYLKRQEKRIQRRFWDALDHICEGPFPADDPMQSHTSKARSIVRTAMR